MSQSSTLFGVLLFTPIPYFFIPQILWFFFRFSAPTASKLNVSAAFEGYRNCWCFALKLLYGDKKI
jgi:hypothetical protein